jgi:hypothetical protein
MAEKEKKIWEMGTQELFTAEQGDVYLPSVEQEDLPRSLEDIELRLYQSAVARKPSLAQTPDMLCLNKRYRS